MSKPANTSLIGVFVFGGILLAIVAVGLFGSGQFNSKSKTFVAYFDDSVNGLDIGSPVKFRGVTIGKVSQVLIRTEEQNDDDNSVPVIIEIEEKLLSGRGILDDFSSEDDRQELIERGLRARLQQLSIVTGMLYVELDYHPDTPAQFHQRQLPSGILEIPTLTSNLGTLMKSVMQTLDQISRVRLDVISTKVEQLLASIDKGVNQIEFDRINKGVVGVVESADKLLKNEDLQKIPANLNAAIDDLRKLTEHINTQLDPVSAEFQKTAEQSRATLKSIERVSENIRLMTQPGSNVRLEVAELLEQINDAALSFKTLMDYLKRNPSALLLGRPEQADGYAPNPVEEQKAQ